jgi:hypothetical protein
MKKNLELEEEIKSLKEDVALLKGIAKSLIESQESYGKQIHFDYDLIDKFPDFFNWKKISNYANLPEDFIIKYHNRLDLDDVVFHIGGMQKMSEETMKFLLETHPEIWNRSGVYNSLYNAPMVQIKFKFSIEFIKANPSNFNFDALINGRQYNNIEKKEIEEFYKNYKDLL